LELRVLLDEQCVLRLQSAEMLAHAVIIRSAELISSFRGTTTAHGDLLVVVRLLLVRLFLLRLLLLRRWLLLLVVLLIRIGRSSGRSSSSRSTRLFGFGIACRPQRLWVCHHAKRIRTQ